MIQERVLVVGSNSFSGSHFVSGALKRGYEVIGVSRSPEPDTVFLPYRWGESKPSAGFRFYQYDLNKHLDQLMALIRDLKIPYVVNFAAQSMVGQSWEYPDHWFKTNVVSTINFHNALRQCSFLEKYLHVSTPEVYGSCEGLVAENISYNPSTPYAVSRAAADMSLKTFVDNYNFPVVFTRAANVYGPGQQLYRIIPRAVLFFLTGRTLELHGGGASVRSFIHINDVVDGTLDAMAHGDPGEIFHLSTRENISIRSLVMRIAERVGVDFDNFVKVVSDRPGKDSAYLLDSRLAEKRLGWRSRIDLDDGLDQTIAWVRTHLERLENQPLDYIHKA
ncbi:MAG TPA: dTDP-glucose 4,6-dehydratase [Desulfobacteraceae bacterium]|nr:dTDP-glucose 4,6-dehydratase [Desulfobacteraceae bacterium]